MVEMHFGIFDDDLDESHQPEREHIRRSVCPDAKRRLDTASTQPFNKGKDDEIEKCGLPKKAVSICDRASVQSSESCPRGGPALGNLQRILVRHIVQRNSWLYRDTQTHI